MKKRYVVAQSLVLSLIFGVTSSPIAPRARAEPVVATIPQFAQITTKPLEIVEKLFVQKSGCPIQFLGSSFRATVTSGNRVQIIRDIVNTTVVPEGFNGMCGGTKSLAEAVAGGLLSGKDVAEYRAIVSSLVQIGDVALNVHWLDGGPAFSTIGIEDSNGSFDFEPMASSWLEPLNRREHPLAPQAGFQQCPTAAAPSAAELIVQQLPGVTWTPWGADGVAVTEDMLGIDRVSKTVSISLVTDAAHTKIITQCETADVSATLAKAERRKKSENFVIEERYETIECKKFTVEVIWTSITGTITVKAGTGGFDVNLEIGGIGSNGFDDQVYILCADGKSQFTD